METFDRSFYEFGEGDLKEMWEPDFDSAMQDPFGTDTSDWTALLDHQLVILNDRMMTDALQSPRITSEHSYSLVTNEELSSLDGSRLDLANELDSECFPAIPLSSATGNHSEMFIKQEPLSAPSSPQHPSPSQSPSPFQKSNISSNAATTSTCSQSLLKQPTIILATRPPSQRCVYLPKVNVKLEPPNSGFSLPPTPPSSTSSDSEGSLSPVHSQQPSSPSAVTMSPGSNNSTMMSTRRPSSLGSMGRCHTNTPLISSQPKGATGLLMLTEEEKRTLIAEGYPIPSKLPLTKAEEKSLKKIRRKIKNKISAQESRRKKKEYMDALEKKVDKLHSENSEYKRKLDSLESNNKSLLSQLHKLQVLVGQLPNRVARNASTQTSLMVLVVFFALSFGFWGTSLSLTSSSLPALPSSVFELGKPSDKLLPCQDPYSTLNRRSRLLLAFLEDENDYRNDDEITCKDDQCRIADNSNLGISEEEPFPAVRGVVDNVLSSESTEETDDSVFLSPQFFFSESDKDNALTGNITDYF